MSTTPKKAPGKPKPAAALRTKPAPAKSAADIKGQPKPLQFRDAPRPVDPHGSVHTVPGAASVAGATGLFVGGTPLREWAGGVGAGFTPEPVPPVPFCHHLTAVRASGGFSLFVSYPGMDQPDPTRAIGVASTTSDLLARIRAWAAAENPNAAGPSPTA